MINFKENQFLDNMMASIGVDFKLKNLEVDGKKVNLQIWDTAGQERYKTITTSYYKGANAIIIVYDITDEESFEHIKSWLDEIHNHAKENVLLFLVGNKSDLDAHRRITFKQGGQVADQYNLKFFESSAKSTFNVENIFVEATKTFIKKLDSANKSIQKTKIDILQDEKQGSKITTSKKKNSLLINVDAKDNESCCK